MVYLKRVLPRIEPTQRPMTPLKYSLRMLSAAPLPKTIRTTERHEEEEHLVYVASRGLLLTDEQRQRLSEMKVCPGEFLGDISILE